MIVDSHVHLLPGRLGAAVRRVFDELIPGVVIYPNDHEAVVGALAAMASSARWAASPNAIRTQR